MSAEETTPKLKPHPSTMTGYIRPLDNGANVYEAALERIAYLYGRFDHVIFGFSGGKDSTVLLNLGIEVARALNKLPIRVKMVDDELIDPDTIDFYHRVYNNPDVQMDWIAAPVQHSLKGKNRDKWFTFDPQYEEIWARMYPDFALRDIDKWESPFGGFEALSMHYIKHIGFKYKDTCVVTGIRVEEAFNRRRSIMNTTGYITTDKAYAYAKPIYDWSVKDVWKYLGDKDYSAYYDKMRKAGVNEVNQRLGPWGNAQSRETKLYGQLYPAFWERALIRIPEMAMAYQLQETGMLSSNKSKPVGMTWQEYALTLIENLPENLRKKYQHKLRHILDTYHNRSTLPFPDTDENMTASRSWKGFANMVMKHDPLDRSR